MKRLNPGIAGTLAAGVLSLPAVCAAAAPPDPLPPPSSADFCVVIQQRMATTPLKPHNTVFSDIPSFRHSKPSADPFEIYQYVTHAGQRPIMVSCKMKTAGMLRSVYGANDAGAQLQCPDIAREIRAEAIGRLQQNQQTAAADRASAFVIDDNEPYVTGYSYLQDFPLSYRARDGRIHLNSPGLYQDYDAWYTALLPQQLKGQSYCHLATVDYVIALATGEMQPGTVVTMSGD